MRTTLEIDDDVVSAVKELAKEQGITMGQVVSNLARRSLEAKGKPKMRNGVPLLTPRPGAKRATMELVNALRDDE